MADQGIPVATLFSCVIDIDTSGLDSDDFLILQGTPFRIEELTANHKVAGTLVAARAGHLMAGGSEATAVRYENGIFKIGIAGATGAYFEKPEVAGLIQDAYAIQGAKWSALREAVGWYSEGEVGEYVAVPWSVHSVSVEHVFVQEEFLSQVAIPANPAPQEVIDALPESAKSPAKTKAAEIRTQVTNEVKTQPMVAETSASWTPWIIAAVALIGLFAVSAIFVVAKVKE